MTTGLWDNALLEGKESHQSGRAFARKALILLVKVLKKGGAAWGTRTHDPIITKLIVI